MFLLLIRRITIGRVRILHLERMRHLNAQSSALAVSLQSPFSADCIIDTFGYSFRKGQAPRYLVRDGDGVYGTAVTRRLRAMGIRDKPIAPASPWQNGYAERLIGSIRRDCLHHIIVMGEAHLHRTLRWYADYYNQIRTHWSLGKDAPVQRPVQRVGTIRSHAVLGGLHHHYVRI